MKLNKKLMGTLLGGLLAISCTSAMTSKESDGIVEYKCGKDMKVIATYMNDGIMLNVDGKELNMTIKPSGSGVYYEGDNASFHAKSDMGILNMGKEDIKCKVSKW